MMKKWTIGFISCVICLFGMLGVSPVHAEAAGAMGYVNLQAVFAAYPDINAAGKTIVDKQKKSQEEYNTQAPKLNDEEKNNLMKELNQELAKKQGEVMQPIRDSIVKAIGEAAQAKGIDYVIKSENILYGGTDLTQDVIDIVKQKQ